MKSVSKILLAVVAAASMSACRDGGMKARKAPVNAGQNGPAANGGGSGSGTGSGPAAQVSPQEALKQRVFVVKSAKNTVSSSMQTLKTRDSMNSLLSEMSECGVDLNGPICLNHESRKNKDNKLEIDMQKMEARLSLINYDVPFSWGIPDASYMFVFKLVNDGQNLNVAGLEIMTLVKDEKNNSSLKAGKKAAMVELVEMTDKQAVEILNDTANLDVRRALPAMKHLMISPSSNATPAVSAAAIEKGLAIFRSDNLENGEDLTDDEEIEYQRALLDTCYAGYKAGRLDQPFMHRFARNFTSQDMRTKALADLYVSQTQPVEPTVQTAKK